MPIPENFQFLSPWKPLDDDERRVQLLSSLKKSLPLGHRLYGLKVRAIAVRLDQDDVLLEVEENEEPLAVVHLTWQKESDPRWPRTKFFKGWEEWSRDEMLPSYQDYELGSEDH